MKNLIKIFKAIKQSKTILFAIIGFFTVPFIYYMALFAITFITPEDLLKKELENLHFGNYKIEAGNIEYSIFPSIKLHLRDVTITSVAKDAIANPLMDEGNQHNADGATFEHSSKHFLPNILPNNSLRIEKLQVSPSLAGLFRGNIDIRDATLEGFTATISSNSGGEILLDPSSNLSLSKINIFLKDGIFNFYNISQNKPNKYNAHNNHGNNNNIIKDVSNMPSNANAENAEGLSAGGLFFEIKQGYVKIDNHLPDFDSKSLDADMVIFMQNPQGEKDLFRAKVNLNNIFSTKGKKQFYVNLQQEKKQILDLNGTYENSKEATDDATDADVYGDKDGKIFDINANFSANMPIKYLASFLHHQFYPHQKFQNEESQLISTFGEKILNINGTINSNENLQQLLDVNFKEAYFDGNKFDGFFKIDKYENAGIDGRYNKYLKVNFNALNIKDNEYKLANLPLIFSFFPEETMKQFLLEISASKVISPKNEFKNLTLKSVLDGKKAIIRSLSFKHQGGTEWQDYEEPLLKFKTSGMLNMETYGYDGSISLSSLSFVDSFLNFLPMELDQKFSMLRREVAEIHLKQKQLSKKRNEDLPLYPFKIMADVLIDGKFIHLKRIDAGIKNIKWGGNLSLPLHIGKEDVTKGEISIDNINILLNQRGSNQERFYKLLNFKRYANILFPKMQFNIAIKSLNFKDLLFKDVEFDATLHKLVLNIDKFRAKNSYTKNIFATASFMSSDLTSFSDIKIKFDKITNIFLGKFFQSDYFLGAVATQPKANKNSYKKPAYWNNQTFNLSFLSFLKGKLSIATDNLEIADNFNLTNIELQGEITKNALDIKKAIGYLDRMKISLYGSIGIISPHLSVTFNLVNADFARLAFIIHPKIFLQGVGSLSGSLLFSGNSISKWMQDLRGHISIYTSGITIKGFDLRSLAERLNSVRSRKSLRYWVETYLNEGETQIGFINDKLQIENGAVILRDFNINSSAGKIITNANIDLFNKYIELKSVAIITIKNGFKVNLPLSINGEFNKPLVFWNKKETEEYWDKLFYGR